MLVNPRLVREGVAADDRLVGLREHAGFVGQQAAGAHDLARVHAALERDDLGPRPARHHDLLERSVAGALPDAVDGTLHLAGTGFDRGQRVRDCEAEVVVAMRAQHHFAGLGDALAHGPEQPGVLRRRRVAHRIRQVDCGGSLRDRDRDDLAEKVQVAAGRVLGGEFDVSRVAAGAADGGASPFDARRAVDTQLLLEMEIRGRDEHVDALAQCRAQRLGSRVDVAIVAARQRGDGRTPYRLRYLLHPAQVSLRCGGKAGFDDVHAERVELAGQSQLGFRCHGIAGRLLAVTQRGIEDDHILSHGLLLRLAVKKKDREPDWVRGAGSARPAVEAATSCSPRAP